MTAIERAQADAKQGRVVAVVALESAAGRARDWPQAFREMALREYGLLKVDQLAGKDGKA